MQTAPTYVPPHGLLRGKSVLVTAAAGAGIGFAMAKRAAEEGCRALFISDVHEKRLAAAAQSIRDETGLQSVYTRLCNVSAQDQVSALVSEADQSMDGIDVLVNNAGLGTSQKVVDMADQEWDQVIGVTLTGTFRMMRAALAVMQPRGRGVIINNASVLGWRAQAEQAHYAAAKAGVMALTRCAALEAAEFGIRINAVAPSIAIHAFLKKSAPQELLDQLSAREAFGRAAEPWEVANVMVFLASDYSSYMTGEVISVSSQRA
ncbi:MAG: SDR family oxidoreductase [Betaproteobacteria bacterium]|jgi:3-oxoacyl-[acyl-carrier protein] reductase|nr:SDR family oxidoreductase [Betaproteobacteria bacterium]